MRADPPCECQKQGGGVQITLYRYKTLKISVLFATKRDVFGQKWQKCGFCFSFLFNSAISKQKEKARNEKVKS